MKILHIGHSDKEGGAGRAAYRIHRSLCRKNIDSIYYVKKKLSNDDSVKIIPNKFLRERRRLILRFILNKVGNYSDYRSFNITSNRIVQFINDKDTDIVNLHWIGGGLIPIYHLNKFQKNIVWRLPDLWPIYGSAHYCSDIKDYSFVDNNLIGFDKSSFFKKYIENYLINLKRKYIEKKITFICPSHYIKDMLSLSPITKNNRAEVIGTSIDHKIFKPLDKGKAKKSLKFSPKKVLIAFGALNAFTDKRKGWSLLKIIIQYFIKNKNIHFVIFGSNNHSEVPYSNTTLIGNIDNDRTLNTIYNAADLIIMPSLIDNLPGVAIEAEAVGTPIIGFDIGGLRDVVKNEKTGILVRPYDLADMIKNIENVIENKNLLKKLSKNSLERSLNERNHEFIANKYINLYQSLKK